MRVAVVTGASAGIGREFVYAIDRQENLDEIWVIARRADRLEELKDKCRTPVRPIVLDLSELRALDDYKAIRTYYLEEDDEDYELEGDQQWFADSNENTTDKYGDEIGFYWDFDPYDFSEYGFEVQEKEYGFLITFNRFGYSTDEMPEEIFSSDAIKYSLDSLLKKYPDVAYYRYEGCVVIFHNTNETINEEYYSSENEIPETDDYIGERMSSLDWDEVINSFSEYDEDINEETAKELTEFVEKYKDYIGDENISAIKEALKEYCSDKDDE